MTEGLIALEPKIAEKVEMTTLNPAAPKEPKLSPEIKPTLSTRSAEEIKEMHKFKSDEEKEEENASGRLKNFFSGILKWTSHKGMFAGLGAAGLGYLVHPYLSIPGLLVGVPSGIVNFITPKSKSKTGESFAQSLNTIMEAVKDPAQIKPFSDKFKKLFEGLIYQVEKMTPVQIRDLYNQATELSRRFSPNDYSINSRDKIQSVKESLTGLINQLSTKIHV